MEKSESIDQLAAALSEAQGEMPAVPMGSKNPFLKNRYANLGDVIKTAFPVLSRHGLSISQAVLSEGDMIGVETVLMHSSGQWLMSKMYSASGEEKGISTIQVIGKTITYLRRYTLSSVLGVYADEDADGNGDAAAQSAKAQPPRPVTVPGAFMQRDLIAYAATKHVLAANVSAALRANPETNPDNWDPKKEAQYKAVVDQLAMMPAEAPRQ